MNKLIIIILALILVGVVVAAENETNSTDPGDTINVTENVTIEEPEVNVTENVTIELNETLDLNETLNETNTTLSNETNGNQTNGNQTNGNQTNGNQTNETTLENINITSLNPPNGRIFGKEDTLPSTALITYTGTLNLNESNITLQHNGQTESWITFRAINPGEFYFQLDQHPDGVYSGSWDLVSSDNLTTHYDYEFSIITTQPPKAYDVQPSKGQYKTESTTLEARINGSYSIQWIISDGYPSASNSKWKSLGQNGDRFSQSINFANTDIGAIYLKILDQAGNYRIQPTGIISTPNFEIDPEDRKISVYQDEIAEFEFLIKKKDPDQNLLRCRLENLIKDKGTALEKKINIAGITTLTFDNDDADLKTDYDQTLSIGRTRESTVTMEIDIPVGVIAGTYKTEIECLIAK